MTLFNRNVSNYINQVIKGKIMEYENNDISQIEVIDAFKMLPGLKERMEKSLESHGKLYFKIEGSIIDKKTPVNKT